MQIQTDTNWHDSKAVSADRWVALKRDFHHSLIQAIDHGALRNLNEGQVREQLRRGAEELCRTRAELLGPSDRRRLIDELVAEILGYGPLEPLLRDSTINDILINGHKTVYVERQGRLEVTPITFDSEQHLLGIIQKIVARVGRRIDEASPMVDARLPDGSRVNAIIRPLAMDGALVSIRKFRAAALSADSLIANGTVSTEMLLFLAACVRAKANLVISGGTGSGKTTLLNILSTFIPREERIVTIEDAAELQLSQPHVARMETRARNLEGMGEVSARDLLRNALRMRPDRIIIGECRGGESFDMLQAMNTGHEGSLTTLHANTTKDALYRLGMLVGMSGYELPISYIDRQIAASIEIVVQVSRLIGGVRKVTQISEVQGVENGEIVVHDIFRFQQTGVDEAGIAKGSFRATGILPNILKQIHERGIELSPTIFALNK